MCLYRDPNMTCNVLDPKNSSNFPYYASSKIVNLFLTYEVVLVEGCENLIFEEERFEPLGLWNLRFDGACNANGNGVGVLLLSPKRKEFSYGFKLEFGCTNNVEKYEAIILGLDTTRNMCIKLSKIFGDPDLVVN
jgi:hypothetical protein